VVENVPTAIIVKDAQSLNYVLVNRSAEDYFGMPREAMIGKSAAELFPPATATGIAARDRHLLAGSGRLRTEENNVQLRPGEFRLTPTTRLRVMDDVGQPRYLVTVIEDLEERRRAEARIERLAHYDTLTELPNRTAFNAGFSAMLERAVASNGSL